MMRISRLGRTRSLSWDVENSSDGNHYLEIGRRHHLRNALGRQMAGRENAVYRLDGKANVGDGPANRRNVVPLSINGEDPSKTMNGKASIDIDITTATTTDKPLVRKGIGRRTTFPPGHEGIGHRNVTHSNNTDRMATGRMIVMVDSGMSTRTMITEMTRIDSRKLNGQETQNEVLANQK
jgi:hypothetical protein